MAARVRSRSQRNTNSRLFMLSLGLLVGFIFGFVIFLSRLPVDGGISALNANEPNGNILDVIKFDYYSHLPEQKVARKALAASVSTPVVVDSAATPTAQDAKLEPVATATVSAQPIAQPTLASSNSDEPQLGGAGQAMYFLQAGNYPQAAQAERARAAVLMLGLDAFIVVRQDNGGSLGHRVRVGPFYNQSRLLEARQRLRTDGIPYQMIRVKG